MNAITLIPNTTTGSITIDIMQTSSVMKIVRTNANGSAEVRVAQSQLPAVLGRLIVTDYEAAHGTNTYNAYLADGTFSTATTTLVIDKPWLVVPIAPNYSSQVIGVSDYSAERETHSTVHRIIGRADPVISIGKLSSRFGSIEFLAESLADANRIVRVFDRGEAVFLKQTVEGADMYFNADSVSVEPLSDKKQRFKVSVDYTEVIRPYGFLAGALGWTYAQLASEYATYDAVAAAFDSYDDLTLQDVS